MTLDAKHPAVKAATEALTAHVKATAIPTPDTFGTGISYAFNPSIEECLVIALEAAQPHLPRPVLIAGCDPETRAQGFNDGFDTAMTLLLAPDDQISAADEWLEARLEEARQQGFHDALMLHPQTLERTHPNDSV